MKRVNIKKDTKKLTVCAMLSALGVIFLYAGALIEVVDISMAAVASLLCVISVIEYGKTAPWAIYGVTSLLSLLILPNKTPAVFYALFFGFYPILKEKFEKRNKTVCWILKEIAFNISLALTAVASYFLTVIGDNSLINPLTIGIVIVLSEAVFVLYDIAMTRLISFYIVKLRPRLKLNK